MSLQDVIKERYGQVASSRLSSQDDGVRKVAEAFGYSAEQLSSIPAGANMGLSCGNPIATASLRPGEVVVDLGSGGGLDVFLAAKKVGPTGKAIGIDMTPEMVRRAKKNAAETRLDNVEFHEASIDRLPLPDSSVDCIISNCVINLAPDKDAVFREMFRVLRPGGRVAVSDIALKQALPGDLAADLMAHVGCIGGAISIAAYDQGLRAAGFEAVYVADTGADLNAYKKIDGQSACCAPPMKTMPGALSIAADHSCCGAPCAAGEGDRVDMPTVHENLTAVLDRYDVNDFAASVKVYAVRPE